MNVSIYPFEDGSQQLFGFPHPSDRQSDKVVHLSIIFLPVIFAYAALSSLWSWLIRSLARKSSKTFPSKLLTCPLTVTFEASHHVASLPSVLALRPRSTDWLPGGRGGVRTRPGLTHEVRLNFPCCSFEW